jgi:hypothetical protein
VRVRIKLKRPDEFKKSKSASLVCAVISAGTAVYGILLFDHKGPDPVTVVIFAAIAGIWGYGSHCYWPDK